MSIGYSPDVYSCLVDNLQRSLEESQKNALFYRCCALNGQVPNDGDEPYPASKGSDV